MTTFSGNPSMIFALKLKGLKEFLKNWNNDFCSSMKGEIERIKKNILDLDHLEDERGPSKEYWMLRESLRKEFQMVAIKKETFWRQRS